MTDSATLAAGFRLLLHGCRLDKIITCIDRMNLADLGSLSEALITFQLKVVRFEPAALLHEIIYSARAIDFG